MSADRPDPKIAEHRDDEKLSVLDRIIKSVATNPVATGSLTFLAGAAGVALALELGPTSGLAAGAGMHLTLGLLRERTAQRQRKLKNAVEMRVERLEEQSRLTSDTTLLVEFVDVFTERFVGVAFDEEPKIELFAGLLAGTVSLDRPKALDARAILRSLSGLTSNEIALALAVKQNWDTSILGPIITEIEKPDWGPDTDYHLNRLDAAGLIEPVPAPYPAQAAGTFLMRPTNTMARMVELLEAGGGLAEAAE